MGCYQAFPSPLTETTVEMDMLERAVVTRAAAIGFLLHLPSNQLNLAKEEGFLYLGIVNHPKYGFPSLWVGGPRIVGECHPIKKTDGI